MLINDNQSSDRVAPNVAKNDFESVVSRLEWNIENWPGRRLDRVIDNANYTCASTGNLVRAEGVSSTTYFRVECKSPYYFLKYRVAHRVAD